jgi:hypothetical protein
MCALSFVKANEVRSGFSCWFVAGRELGRELELFHWASAILLPALDAVRITRQMTVEKKNFPRYHFKPNFYS